MAALAKVQMKCFILYYRHPVAVHWSPNRNLAFGHLFLFLKFIHFVI